MQSGGGATEQAAVTGAAGSAATSETANLLSPPLDVMALITAALTAADARSLASTTSTALALFLKTCMSLHSFYVDSSLMRCTACLVFSPDLKTHSTASLRCRLWAEASQGVCRVHVLLHAIPAICAVHLAATADTGGPATTTCQLPAAALGAVVRVEDDSKLTALPAGMHTLQEITLRSGRALSHSTAWLPPSSAACVRSLHVAGTDLRRLPEGMDALEEVDVSRCQLLEANWLRTETARSMRVVRPQTPASPACLWG